MEREEIKDTENKIWILPDFISNWFVKNYYQQGLIQIDIDTGDLTICGDTIKWLDSLCVRTTSQKRADRLMFDFLNKKYPQYKPYIQIW